MSENTFDSDDEQPGWVYEYIAVDPARGAPAPATEHFVRNSLRLNPGAILLRRRVGEWEQVQA